MCVVYMMCVSSKADEHYRYDSCVPPMLIHMWLDKAPMLFLVFTAVSFVIGLNLLAYLSLQVRRRVS